MSQNRRNYRKAAQEEDRRRRSGGNRSEYVYGNTVQKIEPQEEWVGWQRCVAVGNIHLVKICRCCNGGTSKRY